jgi:hypothetical protein
MPSFDEWFKRATGNDPFRYQRRFAEKDNIPALVDVPTCLRATHRQAGLGKGEGEGNRRHAKLHGGRHGITTSGLRC